jgi:NAD(P)H dehydrogenase (quinone)
MEGSDKKHFLIVYSHANDKSFNSAVKEKTIQAILEHGHTYELSDLYKMNFHPVAGPLDFKELLNADDFNLLNEQQNSIKNNLYVEEIKIEMDKLKKADYLILIFPLWWASVPAILKGWIDRIFSCDFAWGYNNHFNSGLMIGKRAAIFTTLGGDKKEYSLEGDQKASLLQTLYHIHRGSLAFCGFDVLPIHSIYEVETCSEEERKLFLNEIDNIVKNFGNSQLLHKMSE